jgi:hypothetical protein
MTINYSIADEVRRLREVPPEVWQFVDPDDIEVRTAKPKWTWVSRVCHEIPEGKCILLPKPEGMSIEHFMDNLRCALQASKATLMDKFSVRRSKHEDYAVVMKSGTWAKLYRSMES